MNYDQPVRVHLRQKSLHLRLPQLRVRVRKQQIDRPLYLHLERALIPQVHPSQQRRSRQALRRLRIHHRIELARNHPPTPVPLEPARNPLGRHPQKRPRLQHQLRLQRRHQRCQQLQHLHLRRHRVNHRPAFRVRALRRRPVVLRQQRARRALVLQHHLVLLLQLLAKQSHRAQVYRPSPHAPAPIPHLS